jgi:hypothetical protein
MGTNARSIGASTKPVALDWRRHMRDIVDEVGEITAVPQ